MASRQSIASLSGLLSANFRALSLSSTTTTTTRALSSAILPSISSNCATSFRAHTIRKSVATPVLVGAVQQKPRGMKVLSAIKKRCEHCKIVRRKKGKRSNGYRYVICSANPRHKQRQGS